MQIDADGGGQAAGGVPGHGLHRRGFAGGASVRGARQGQAAQIPPQIPGDNPLPHFVDIQLLTIQASASEYCGPGLGKFSKA